MVVHLDTSFLVDLMREQRHGRNGPARAWLEAHLDESLSISVPVLCEILVGVELHGEPGEAHRRVRRVCGGLRVVPLDERVAGVYARVAANLSKSGALVGAMDALIASVALSDGAALLTRNTRHFDRIPDLLVLDY